MIHLQLLFLNCWSYILPSVYQQPHSSLILGLHIETVHIYLYTYLHKYLQ